MRAVTWHGKRDVRVDTVPDPTIQDPTDVDRQDHLDRDLRLRPAPLRGDGPVHDRGRHPRPRTDGHRRGGRLRGHRTAPSATGWSIPFNISCGTCFMCDRACTRSARRPRSASRACGASLFGYTKLYGQVPGGQAEYLRVPFGNTLPIKVPGGPAGRPVRLPVRRAAHRVAGRPVRRRAAGRHARRARPRPDRRHGHPDRRGTAAWSR